MQPSTLFAWLSLSIPVWICLVHFLFFTAWLCLSIPLWIILPASPRWHICVLMFSKLHYRSSYCYCMLKKKKKTARCTSCHSRRSGCQDSSKFSFFGSFRLCTESSSQHSSKAWAHKCVIMTKHHFGVCLTNRDILYSYKIVQEASHGSSSWTFCTTEQCLYSVASAKLCTLFKMKLNYSGVLTLLRLQW